jgi:CRP-like cAMP-binding protein
MHEALITYIQQFSSTPLSAESIQDIKDLFIPKKLRRKQYFLQEGEVCKYHAFIVKGAMRQYTIDEKGAEHIVQLCIENWWAGDRESWAMLSPSKFNIDAWEDTELLMITRANFLNLMNRCPVINNMIIKLDENSFIAREKRITLTISSSAAERYADFVTSHPEFLQRFPQHLIASYLGITKDTLSRIRKQSSKK